MPSQEEVNRIIEQAKKNKGIDMSWLKPAGESQAGVGAMTDSVERISPGASQLMAAVQQAQAQTPVYIPFAGGTPTQQRRQADEAVRQFDVGQALAKEQWDWERDYKERQFSADQSYRNAQLALSRQKATTEQIDPNAYDPKDYASAYKIAKENYEKPQLFWVGMDESDESVPYAEGSSPPSFGYTIKEIPTTKAFEDLSYAEQKNLIDKAYYTVHGLPGDYSPNIPSSLQTPGTKNYYMDIAQTALEHGYSREDIAALLVENYGVNPDELGSIAPDLAGMYKRYPQAPADFMKQFRGIIGR